MNPDLCNKKWAYKRALAVKTGQYGQKLRHISTFSEDKCIVSRVKKRPRMKYDNYKYRRLQGL